MCASELRGIVCQAEPLCLVRRSVWCPRDHGGDAVASHRAPRIARRCRVDISVRSSSDGAALAGWVGGRRDTHANLCVRRVRLLLLLLLLLPDDVVVVVACRRFSVVVRLLTTPTAWKRAGPTAGRARAGSELEWRR